MPSYINYLEMKVTVGVYNSHDEAVEAIRKLKDIGISSSQVSLIGKAHTVDNELVVKHTNIGNVAAAEMSIGAALGSTLGILTGVGVFTIPGLGFLYGAGALVGAIAGFDFGLLGGGIASALTVVGITGTDAETYESDLQGGKFIVIAQGTVEELEKAKNTLTTHGKHTRLSHH